MAEDLNDFLKKKKFKAKYVHSDVKTMERTKILKEFREGKFDTLIGVNLLREGLDLPEVSLVAILDADREGFLRSETSLIQIMGRCARNVKGKVIIYADTKTGSIKRALSEVDRRRKVQLEYNRKNKITPRSITKKIENMIGFD
jgi:excinuclease ABC subunit B